MGDDVVEVDVVEGKEKEGATNLEGLIKDWEAGGKNGPMPGSERWNEVYWEAKEGKRAKDELVRERADRAKDREAIDAAREHNKALVEAIDKFTTVVEGKDGDAELKGLEDKVVELKVAKKSAREKADFDRESQIDDEIVDLKIEIRDRKAAVKAATEKKATAPVKVEDDKGGELTPEEAAVYKKWAGETEWFRSDPRMRKAAMEAETETWADPDFEFATIAEVLAEVKKKVEEKFEWKPSGNEVKGRRGAGVESGVGDRGVITKIKLSTKEQTIMQGLGVPQEEYAKQKALIAKSKGGA